MSATDHTCAPAFSQPDGGTVPSPKPPSADAPVSAEGCPTGFLLIAHQAGQVTEVLYDDTAGRLYDADEVAELVDNYRHTPECAGESYTVIEVK